MPQSRKDWLVNAGLRVLFGAMRLLPHARRVALMGWITHRLIGSAAGYNRRSRTNLAMIFPKMPRDERRRIARAAADNAGRTLMEIFSGESFAEIAEKARPLGPGFPAIETALARGQPVILASGHIGNYDAPRAYFTAKGVPVGGLYKPLANAAFNHAYVDAISKVSGPVFERGRHGLGQMIAFLKGGGMLGLLFDQRIPGGAPLDFLGRPALTALSTAELALKYGALLVPIYGIRRENGVDFDLVSEAPIPEGEPKAMMQALTDSLAAQIRTYPEQYFWIHKRWKL
jgi:KDO2-lipid IV(A) lauroyltransferase